MGFQVTPCVLPSPDREREKDNCSREGKKIALPSSNHDPHGLLNITSSCTSSLSLRSLSTNLLLSQCSSLASLPSLGLSFNGGSDTQLCSISAPHCTCTCLTTLRCLGDQVACTSSSADSFFFSASSSSTSFPPLKAWPKHGGAGFYSAAGTGFGSKKEGAVRALVVMGDQVFSAHDDLKVRVWARPGSGKKETSCIGGSGGGGGEHNYKLVAALPTTWDCMARSVAPGGYVQVRRHHKKLWIQHADAISALAIDGKEGCLYSASWDRSVKVWRLRDFKCIESFKAHDDAINTLALSTDGFLYTACADGKIKAWARQLSSTKRRHQHSLVATLEAHRSAVNALAVSSDGALLYSGACDKAIVVWEREDSAQHASLAGALRGHRQAVLCLATCGATLCSGSADKSIRVWQRVAGRLHACVVLLQGHAAPVKSLSLSSAPDAASASSSSAALTLYSAALDDDVKVWKLCVN